MKKIMKCCLAVALGLAVAGCSKESSGGSGGGGSGKSQEHKKVQLWKDGPYWAETNIGAEKPWDFGYDFWWGDTIGYKFVNNTWVASDGSSSNFSFNTSDTPTANKNESALREEGWITADGVLALKHDAAHVHWGGKWRMPTVQELNELSDKCDWTWTKMNGVDGYVVRGRGDYASANIFLPSPKESIGRYWSSVPTQDTFFDAWELNIDSSDHHTCEAYRNEGHFIRPVQGGSK